MDKLHIDKFALESQSTVHRSEMRTRAQCVVSGVENSSGTHTGTGTHLNWQKRRTLSSELSNRANGKKHIFLSLLMQSCSLLTIWYALDAGSIIVLINLHLLLLLRCCAPSSAIFIYCCYSINIKSHETFSSCGCLSTCVILLNYFAATCAQYQRFMREA